jgi:hypothetical protein
MAIWGWDSKFYVETGIIPATRDTISQWQMIPNPQQQYYVRRFADDLLKSEAGLFIDATDGSVKYIAEVMNFGHPQGPEDFPDVANILKKYYTLVEDVYGYKIYVKHK